MGNNVSFRIRVFPLSEKKKGKSFRLLALVLDMKHESCAEENLMH
jgi:hypothetical protein